MRTPLTTRGPPSEAHGCVKENSYIAQGYFLGLCFLEVELPSQRPRVFEVFGFTASSRLSKKWYTFKLPPAPSVPTLGIATLDTLQLSRVSRPQKSARVPVGSSESLLNCVQNSLPASPSPPTGDSCWWPGIGALRSGQPFQRKQQTSLRFGPKH